MTKQIKLRVELKDNKPVEHNLIIEKQNDFYVVKCVDKDNEELGFINFEIKNNKVWIYKIETNPNFFHQGIGTALLNTMEYIAMLNNISRVEGKYYPTNEYTKPFYEKYGYYIPNQKKSWDDYDETWTMSKDLDFDKIKSYIEDNLIKSSVEELEK